MLLMVRWLHAQSCSRLRSMFHEYDGTRYLLNLIDTPVRIPFPYGANMNSNVVQGHVDFSWEDSRSMAACQGALLLVDATQGVQAQSLSVFHTARERGLKIIPVMNKVLKFSQAYH